MNDEIKEILDKLKETVDYPKLNYSSYDKSYNETIDNVAMIKSFACKQLLDYITNLQQENERLKIKCDFLVGKKLAEIDKNAKQIKIKAIEHEDYKSRVEKAIDYIENNKRLSMFADCREPEENWNYDLECSANDLLNILYGETDATNKDL